jgi:hypothetical protein
LEYIYAWPAIHLTGFTEFFGLKHNNSISAKCLPDRRGSEKMKVFVQEQRWTLFASGDKITVAPKLISLQ